MISAASDTRCSRPMSRYPSDPAGKTRHVGPVERAAKTRLIERHATCHERADVTHESSQVTGEQGAAFHLVASTDQERVPTFHVAIDEMLEADRYLDEALERDAITAVGPEPVRFQKLVHLEI